MSGDAHGHSCTNHGAVWTSQGRSFNGTSDYIDVVNPYVFPDKAGFTVSLWARSLDSAAQTVVRYIPDDWSAGFIVQLRLNGGGTRAVLYINGTGANVYSDAEFSALSLHTFTKRYNDAYARYYFNGDEKTVTEGTSALHTNISSTTAIAQIGAKTSGEYPSYFEGTVGEVLALGRAWTPAEILNYYISKKEAFE